MQAPTPSSFNLEAKLLVIDPGALIRAPIASPEGRHVMVGIVMSLGYPATGNLLRE